MFCTMRSPSQMCDRTSPSRRKKRNGNVIWHVSGEAKPAHEAPKLRPKRYFTASMVKAPEGNCYANGDSGLDVP